MIFVDSNVPMYLVGASHPHKSDSQRLLENLIVNGQCLVTDAEVLQEILHRYVAIRRPEAVQPAFDALLGIVDDVFSVEADDVQRAKEIVLGFASLSARDSLRLAIMERHRIERILSFDAGFDDFPGVSRVFE